MLEDLAVLQFCMLSTGATHVSCCPDGHTLENGSRRVRSKRKPQLGRRARSRSYRKDAASVSAIRRIRLVRAREVWDADE